MDAAASAPQGYGALCASSRQLSRQALPDDAAFNLVDLPGEPRLILYRLLFAHDIAKLALCSALRDAAQLVFGAAVLAEVRTLSGHTKACGALRRRTTATSSPARTTRPSRCGAATRCAHHRGDRLGQGGACCRRRALRQRLGGRDREAVHLRRRAGAHPRGGLGACVAALPDGVHFVVGLYHPVRGPAVPRRRDARPHLQGAHQAVYGGGDARRPAHHQRLDGQAVKVWSVASKSLVSTCRGTPTKLRADGDARRPAHPLLRRRRSPRVAPQHPRTPSSCTPPVRVPWRCPTTSTRSPPRTTDRQALQCQCHLRARRSRHLHAPHSRVNPGAARRPPLRQRRGRHDRPNRLPRPRTRLNKLHG